MYTHSVGANYTPLLSENRCCLVFNVLGLLEVKERKKAKKLEEFKLANYAFRKWHFFSFGQQSFEEC